MKFTVRNLDTGKSVEVDASDCKSDSDFRELIRDDYHFGPSDYQIVSADDAEAAQFLRGDFLDSRVWDYLQLDDPLQQTAVLVFINTFGGTDDVHWIIDGFIGLYTGEEEYHEFLMSNFNIPDSVERFIDFDAVDREAMIVYQIAKRKDEYYVFQRH